MFEHQFPTCFFTFWGILKSDNSLWHIRQRWRSCCWESSALKACGICSGSRVQPSSGGGTKAGFEWAAGIEPTVCPRPARMRSVKAKGYKHFLVTCRATMPGCISSLIVDFGQIISRHSSMSHEVDVGLLRTTLLPLLATWSEQFAAHGCPASANSDYWCTDTAVDFRATTVWVKYIFKITDSNGNGNNKVTKVTNGQVYPLIK